MRRRSSLLALAIFAASACGSPLSSLDKHRAPAQAKLAKVAALAEVVKGAARLNSNALEVSGPPPNFARRGANAMAVSAEDLDHLTGATSGSLVPINPFENIACWSQSGELSRTSQQYFGMSKDRRVEAFTADLESFLSLHYLLVLRTTKFVRPRVAGQSFAGGSWSGEALLLDLEQKSVLGGVRFSVGNSKTVEANASASEAYVLDDLRSNAHKIVRKAFEDRFSGVEPPFPH